MSSINLRSQIQEDYLTCPICCNNFTKPKALPCIHTFCESCLRDYVYSRGYESQGVFPCPICRMECTMPQQGVEGFPDNHIMSSLSDTVNMTKQCDKPVPKPRRSVGQTPAVPPNGTDVDNPGGNDMQPPSHAGTQPYRSMNRPALPETNFEATAGPDGFEVIECGGNRNGHNIDNSPPPPYSSVADAKVCANDSDPGWMLVPNQSHKDTQPQTPIGWNIQNLLGGHGQGISNAPVSISQDLSVSAPYSQNNIYPSVPPNFSENTACAENLMLRFGKQGSSPRDFLKPSSLAVSKEGQYVVLDSIGEQNRIMVFNSGGEITKAFKCGAKVNDIALNMQNEVIASTVNVHKIRVFSMEGQLRGEFGKFFTYEQPGGIVQSRDGGIILTGVDGHCVYVLNEQMNFSTKFGRKGNGDGYFLHPASVTVDSKNHIIVTDKVNACVQVFGRDGKFKRRFGSKGEHHGQLQAPQGVCVDSCDNIIVADSGNHRVEVFSPSGQWLSSVVKNTQQLGENVRPIDVGVTPTGKVAVLLCGPYFAEVRIFSSRHQQIPQ